MKNNNQITRQLILLVVFTICLQAGYAQKKKQQAINNENTQIVNGETWTADNGNGMFTNPLFCDEFSDPDLIRVGDDYYLTGTTMHAMPGLPVLHSKDLVNWKFFTCACPELDFGPAYRLQEGKDIYDEGYLSFNLIKGGASGGFADFNDVIVTEPRSKGLAQPIPHNQIITLASLADSTVLVGRNGFVRPIAAIKASTAAISAFRTCLKWMHRAIN